MQIGENAIDAAVSQLERYLTENVSEIRKVYREWPNPSYQMYLPSASLLTAAHEITLSRNFEKDREDISGTDVEKKIIWHAGYMGFVVQMDLWTDSKEDRHDLAEKIFRVLNPDIGLTSGLSLTLEQYYNAICRYEVDTTAIEDNEDKAIRNEWRYRFDLRSHMDLLIPKDEYIAATIELQSETQDIAGNTIDQVIVEI